MIAKVIDVSLLRRDHTMSRPMTVTVHEHNKWYTWQLWG